MITKNSRKEVCLYHSADLDGHCSGAIVKRNYPNCILYGIDHGQKCPWDLVGGATVIMVDFSLPYEQMIKLNKISNLIWIDHHISAIKKMEKIEIQGLRSVKKAGCELCWDYFESEPVPKSVRLLGLYDRGKLNTEVLNFQYGIKQFDTSPEKSMWINIFKNYGFKKICKSGSVILKYINRENKKFCDAYYFEVVFEGLKAIVLNRQPSNSHLFEGYEYDIMLSYARKKDLYQISIYTDKDKNIDVSSIAQKYGGGGHKKAAGWITKTLPF